MRTLTYAGVNLKTFGVRISGYDAWKKPQAVITRTSVPGRNGDLAQFENRYENVQIPYRCSIVSGFDENFAALVAHLYAAPGYKKLVDSAHPDVYRMAFVEGGLAPSMTPKKREGEFEVTFDCKPQIFLTSGDAQTTYTSSGSITNPTPFESMPLIRVRGSGTLYVGGVMVTVANNTSYIDIDCDIQDAYRDTVNCNGNITLNSGRFPTLKPGSNSVTLSSGISSVVVTPRWWRL